MQTTLHSVNSSSISSNKTPLHWAPAIPSSHQKSKGGRYSSPSNEFSRGVYGLGKYGLRPMINSASWCCSSISRQFQKVFDSFTEMDRNFQNFWNPTNKIIEGSLSDKPHSGIYFANPQLKECYHSFCSEQHRFFKINDERSRKIVPLKTDSASIWDQFLNGAGHVYNNFFTFPGVGAESAKVDAEFYMDTFEREVLSPLNTLLYPYNQEPEFETSRRMKELPNNLEKHLETMQLEAINGFKTLAQSTGGKVFSSSDHDVILPIKAIVNKIIEKAEKSGDPIRIYIVIDVAEGMVFSIDETRHMLANYIQSLNENKCLNFILNTDEGLNTANTLRDRNGKVLQAEFALLHVMNRDIKKEAFGEETRTPYIVISDLTTNICHIAEQIKTLLHNGSTTLGPPEFKRAFIHALNLEDKSFIDSNLLLWSNSPPHMDSTSMSELISEFKKNKCSFYHIVPPYRDDDVLVKIVELINKYRAFKEKK